MNSTCPSCGITYRIDPSKIPAGGIRARCTKCDGIFRVESPIKSTPTPVAPEAELESPSTAQGGEPTPESASETASEEPAPKMEEPTAPPAFGGADPHRQARRLARALISDIVVYHPERRERSLAAGTLRQDFRDEIRKSWDEYVSRVGEALARQTPYFREALNEILAGGSPVF